MLWPVITFVLFIAGFPLLIVGADALVKGASRLAVAWGVSALAVGLTVVAYGTSMPELAVTVLAVWNDETTIETVTDEEDPTLADEQSKGRASDIAVGNVVGSNIANVLLVLGAAATIAPLIVPREVVKRSLPLMIFVSILAAAFAWDFDGDGRVFITWWQGLILVVGVLVYTWRALLRGRTLQRLEKSQSEEIDEDFGKMGSGNWAWMIEVLRIVLGLVCLVAGGKFLVDGAVAVATWLSVSKLMISLTIVAIGTSLPEVATCVVAVMRGHRDLAVGNAVGSNIFNVLLVLGACALVAPGGGIEISPLASSRDFPIMVVVALLTLPVFYTTYIIARWEGWVFLVLYFAYTTYLVLRASGDDAPFGWLMIWVVAIVFAVVLTQSAWQFFAKRQPHTRVDTRVE